MLCPNCGTVIPDGAGRCPQCGRVCDAPDDGSTFSFENAPEPIHAPGDDAAFSFDFTPSAGGSVSFPTNGAEDGFPSPPAQEPDPPEDLPPEPVSFFTVPDEEDDTPLSALAGAQMKKLLTQKWWFWALLVLAVFIVIVFFAAVFSLAGGKNSADPPADLAEMQLTVPMVKPTPRPTGNPEPAEAPEESGTAPADSDAMTVNECIELIDQSLNATNFTHDFDLYDNWLDIYLQADGTYELARTIHDGDTQGLPEWEELLATLSALSVQYRVLFTENGHEDITVCLNLLDDVDPDYYLSLFIDGDVVFDYATGVDNSAQYE